MKRILYTLAVTLCIVTLAQGQMLLNENFNYGSLPDTLTNPAIGGSTWKRHSGTGGPIYYANTSLAFPGYASSGTGGSAKLVNSSASREDANAAITSITSGSVYTSFLVSVHTGGGTTGDYFFHLGDSSGTAIGSTFRGKIWVKDDSLGLTYSLGLTKGAAVTSAVWTSGLTKNSTYLVVLKYTIVAGTANDSAKLFIFNSTIPANEPAATLVATDITQTDLIQVRSVALRQGNVGTDSLTLDGIRVATSWANSPLPVSLTGFRGEMLNKAVNLTWTTASERNSHAFEIERSTDMKSWNKVAEVKASGNSNAPLNYTFVDGEPVKGASYYRLKCVDLDGNYTYSSIASVVFNTINSLTGTLPNPFTTDLTFTVRSDAGNAGFEVMDVTGKTVYTGSETLKAGENKITINTANFNDGIYFVKMNINGEVSTQKIIKK